MRTHWIVAGSVALAAVAAPMTAGAQVLVDANTDKLAGATTIDFSAYAKGGHSSVAAPGVTFLPGGGGTHLGIGAQGDYGQWMFGMDGNHLHNAFGMSSINFIFTEAVYAFGFRHGAMDNFNWFLNVYDAADNLIGSHNVARSYTSEAGVFVGFADAAGRIARAELTGGQGAPSHDWIMLDDFRYSATGQSTVTPEPITMTLLGTGLFGVAAARRRRRSVVAWEDESEAEA